MSTARIEGPASHEITVLGLKMTRLLRAMELRDPDRIDAAVAEVKHSCERYETLRNT